MSAEEIKRWASRVRREVRRHRSYVVESFALETDEVSAIAERAGVDWLHDVHNGEARFFEFM